MQESFLWSFVALIILILLIGALILRKKYPRPTDYYSFFVIGIMWIIVGIPLALVNDNYFFSIMGIAFTAIGFLNKDKWKKNKQTWKNLKRPEKIFQVVLMAVLTFIIIMGIVFFLIRG